MLRGLHTSPYSKFVSVLSGEVYDIVVDLREESPAFGKWLAHILSLESPVLQISNITWFTSCCRRKVNFDTSWLCAWVPCTRTNDDALSMRQGTFDATREQVRFK